MMKPYKDFFAGQRVLIVDDSSVARIAIARGLTELGASSPAISLAESFEAAKSLLANRAFTILICELNLGGRCGLDLLKLAEKGNSRFILTAVITQDQSEAAAALAAENDVDIFVRKPFSMEELKRSFAEVIEERVNPIRLDLSGEQTAIQAIEMFQKSLDKKRVYDKIGYRALTKLFDTLMSEGKKSDAYLVLRRLITAYPLHPNRLSMALRLAVETRNFADVDDYYRLFLEIDAKDDGLIRHAYAALVSSGKFALKEGDLNRAREQFKRASLASGKRATVLREIVLSLVNEGHHDEADAFLTTFPQHERESLAYLVLDYFVMSKSQPVHVVMQRGRKLIQDGRRDPMIYEILIEACKNAGHESEAESLALDVQRLGNSLEL